MKLEWMGEYRNLLESLIHYCNIYTSNYKPERIEYKNIHYSFATIQVLEYLLENEEKGENMSQIARRLGISRSNFTKIVKKLEDKGLVEKRAFDNNKKDINLVVTTLGSELYDDYAKRIYDIHFSKMFKALDKLSKEDIALVEKGLRDAVDEAIY